MQAIILAAGMGNRLGKYTKNNTKCMLEINGTTLIKRALEALHVNGIRRCVIVVGYQKQNLMDHVGSSYKDMEIVYVSNDVYAKTNNIYSLYLAKDYLVEDDTLLLESDLIFEQRILSELLENPEPTMAVVAPFESWMDGTVVRISGNKTITQFIPKSCFKYSEIGEYYKTVNIYKFSKTFSENSYVPFLEAYSRTMGNNEYYEGVLRIITNLDKNEMKAMVLKKHRWYEIDDVQDKDIAEAIFSSTDSERVEKMQKRFGGYWRFPRLLDYCYLVNPYFPPKTLRQEMKNSFKELLTEYPSGLNVQNLLSGKLFSVDDTCILTGNGAAELIRALGLSLEGSLGVIYPTFNEYPESFPKDRIIECIAENKSYSLDNLLSWARLCDNLLLINPDNPSGNYIARADVLSLLDSMKTDGKKLVLDESFIDFAEPECRTTFLDQDLLDLYPNLIVIKSISKSYGVPGLRLGVLACGDRAFVKSARKHLSIWNINSFAEYFLQIIGKYKKEYSSACDRISEERAWFKVELEQTGLLTVFPSQANYFLCKCAPFFTAGEITSWLLSRHDIFVKDLSGKKGIDGNSWIRLAVRSREDNKRLIKKLLAFKKEKAQS